jgi:hypothetical protein
MLLAPFIDRNHDREKPKDLGVGCPCASLADRVATLFAAARAINRKRGTDAVIVTSERNFDC